MAERYRNPRHGGRRQPLSDITSGANTPPLPTKHEQAGKVQIISPRSLPHNESLEPDGSLAVRHSHPSSPEHKRISQVASGREHGSKRNSAISTTSTNASGRRRKTYIGHWQLGKTIGKGGCSRVRVVRHRFKDQYGAVKIITRSTAEDTRAQSLADLIESSHGAPRSSSNHKPIPYGLEREIAIMKLLEHPNIVRLYDVWENRNELYLIMEYVDGGELFNHVNDRRGLPEDETVYIFRQIVSALLYCHRMRICHRDLKPENILLDRNLAVKLIDFGMAALQPEGRLLSTPCGSPHYAAPEVVSSEPYDGTQADVWSCGVILYVMLTGTTPYSFAPQDGNLRDLFRDIARAAYWMPPELSREAKNLIRRIFVPDPKRRITMDEVWDHPLLHKYDVDFCYEGQAGTKDAALGPIPTLEQWKVKRIQDIDRQILRNMRTLWHSDPEKTLIEKLINDEYNQEKLFYAALLKHREEQFENFVGGADEVDYSASDYHHSRPPASANVPSMSNAPRSQSQYSILNDEHLRPSHSFVEPPPSISSYDPYRASKNPIVNGHGEYVSVTVHRQGSASTRKASIGRSLRHPNALRIEMLKNGSRRASNHSSSSLPRSRHSRMSMARSSMSRNSLTSSVWPSSPPVIATMRPSDLHKRGISFSHIRRTSTNSHLTSQGSSKVALPATPRLPGNLRDRMRLHPEDQMQTPLGSSPTAQVAQAVRSRKERAKVLNTPRITTRNGSTPFQRIRSDIRKHSVELEKACEEAFFRSSAGSDVTAKSSVIDRQSPLDTPPSSISTRSQTASSKPAGRPLPDVPKDTPNTYLSRTLEETREKLAAYKTSGDDGNAAKFEEVMRMLETVMPTTTPPRTQDQRSFTAPEAKTPDHLGFLPVISEESDGRSSKDGTLNWHRSVTAPVQQSKKAEGKTIRIVPPSPPATVAPLNVRKRSNGSDGSDGSQRLLAVKKSHDRLTRKGTNDHTGGLAVIEEDTSFISDDAPAVMRKKKKVGWFGLSKKTAPGSLPRQPSRFSELDDRQHVKPLRGAAQESETIAVPLSAQSSEFPIRKKRLADGKRGLAKWLSKLGGDREESAVDETEIGNTTFNTTFTNNTSTNRSLDSLFSTSSPSPSSNDAPPLSGNERSWFARFFHIRPAVKVLCFSIPRGRARQELVLLFREWQRHGIQDLQYTRETNTITARVDRSNSLDIKPVTFRIELFVVLEHGKRVGVSIARFVQVKGAASGFRRVLEVVDGVMRGRGWLVEDEEKWKALCEVVDGC